MDSEILHSPSFDTLENLLSMARGTGDSVIILGKCTVEWTGYRTGEAGEGERFILCKPDGAISVHRPTGARAVARQGIDSEIELHQLEDSIHLYGQKSNGGDSIRVSLVNIHLCMRVKADDFATVQKRNNEDEMHEYIQSSPEDIEEGFRILHHEHPIPQGTVDFLAADSDGALVIIEVKHPFAKVKHVDQLHRYVKYYRRTEDSATRGVLVAPEIGKKASRVLRDNGLEGCELSEFHLTRQSPIQSSFEDWIQ